MGDSSSNADEELLDFLRSIPSPLPKRSEDLIFSILFRFYWYHEQKWREDSTSVNEEISERLYHLTSSVAQIFSSKKSFATIHRNRRISQLIDILVLFDCDKDKAINAVASLLNKGEHLIDKIAKEYCQIKKETKKSIRNKESLIGSTLGWSPRTFGSLKSDLNIACLKFSASDIQANQAIERVVCYIKEKSINEYEALLEVVGKEFLPRL